MPRLVLFLSLFNSVSVPAQTIQEKYVIHIHHVTAPIKIDGIIDEVDWQLADVAKSFFAILPYDTSFSKSHTECRVTYDDNSFYVSAVCYDELKGNYVIQSLRRDFSFPVTDAFAVVLDPFLDKSNGFNFGVNPYNVQREGSIDNGGGFGVSTDWNVKWVSETKVEEGKWVCEIAIPFNSLRFKPNSDKWFINFIRNDLKRNELSSWVPVPRTFNPSSLAFTGTLIWDKPLVKAGTNISIIPYGISSFNTTAADGNEIKTTPNAGLDAKVGVSSSLNLDLTINPDFSQVEVDAQQTNLTRFNLFYPEKRNFFIENSDLFGQFGFRQIRPFFSRNIGLSSGNVVPIQGGVRLSGKLTPNNRIGVLSIQTADDSIGGNAISGQNYSVLAYQRKIFSRSNIAVIGVNRQAFNHFELEKKDYNRIGGLQYNLASSNNKLVGFAFFMYSNNTVSGFRAYSHAAFWQYNITKWTFTYNHEYVGKNFIADVGFVPRINIYDAATKKVIRNSYWRLEPVITRRFFPAGSMKKSINNFSVQLYSSDYFNEEYKPTELYQEIIFQTNFQNSALFEVDLDNTDLDLQYATSLNPKDTLYFLPGKYNYQSVALKFNSNLRKVFNYNLYGQYGSFYSGNKLTFNSSFTYRFQPYANVSLTLNYNKVDLPSPFQDFNLFLIGPKIELTFTHNLFFTTFLQYNTQIENFNVNCRFQWRFKPLSDFYLVYGDNYDTNTLNNKNRTLVLKFTYWFSI